MPRRGKQHTSATFVRPSTTAVGMARVLLLRLADCSNMTWLPGTTDCHNIIRSRLMLDWEAGRLSVLEFASTPFTFWADVAIMAGFESIWDLLMRESTPKAQRLASPIPLDRLEFWMNEKDDKTHKRSYHDNGVATREQGHVSELGFLTQGAWRTLDVLLFLAARCPEDRFLGSSFMPVMKPLAILFSFPHALDDHEQQTYDKEENYTERLDIAVRLLRHVCTYAGGSVSRDSLYQTSAHLMFRWSQSDLDRFFMIAQPLKSFHDICFVHLHMLCCPGYPIDRYLYGGKDHPCEKALLDMISWKINSALCSRTKFWLSDIELQYRCLGLKWFLLRLSGYTWLLRQGTVHLSREVAEMASALDQRMLSNQASDIREIRDGLTLLGDEMRLHQ